MFLTSQVLVHESQVLKGEGQFWTQGCHNFVMDKRALDNFVRHRQTDRQIIDFKQQLFCLQQDARVSSL